MQHPWLVSIMSSPSPMSQFCVGTLVASEYVLTSAQCVHDKLPSSLHLMIGDQDLADINETAPVLPELELEVAEVLVHSTFHPATRSNDLALLRLAAPVDLAVYAPACLPGAESVEWRNKTQVAGWNATFKFESVEISEVRSKVDCEENVDTFMDEGMLCGIGASCEVCSIQRQILNSRNNLSTNVFAGGWRRTADPRDVRRTAHLGRGLQLGGQLPAGSKSKQHLLTDQVIIA